MPFSFRPGAGLYQQPPWPTGQYVVPYSQSGGSNSFAAENSTPRAAPVVVPVPTPITRLGVHVTAAGEAGAVVRLGVYADNGSGYPGARLLDAGTVPANAVASPEVTVAFTLPAGLLWLVACAQNAPTTAPQLGSRQSEPPLVLPAGNAVPDPSWAGSGLVSWGGIAGAFPATFPAFAVASWYVPRVFVKTA